MIRFGKGDGKIEVMCPYLARLETRHNTGQRLANVRLWYKERHAQR